MVSVHHVQFLISFSERHLFTAGYDYYGTEKLYSGVDGREMTADIFFGIVYYQRLRHMVSDKFQVCTYPFSSHKLFNTFFNTFSILIN